MTPAASATPVGKLTLADALSSARETRELVIGSGALREAPRVFRNHFHERPAVIISDERTFAEAGRALGAIFEAAGIACVAPFVYSDPGLYAEYGFVEQLEASLRLHDAIPVAVGSGTINDLTKLVAHRTGRPGYLCVATAASMDGYTAYGSSITFNGAKQTFDCPAPLAVIADLEIIRRAPSELTAAGYADLSAKVTAGADWILADALGVERIDSRAWAMAQGGLHAALEDPAGARAGHETAIGPLVEGLMLGGFAMQWSRTSRPASGAEHQFSHLWDMEQHVHRGMAPSHGFKVGVATLAITRLYEQLLAQDFSTLDVDRCAANWPDADAARVLTLRLFAGGDVITTALAETAAKHVSPADLRAQLERLKSTWPEVRTRLQAQLLSSVEMERRFALVGAPTEPEQIGITRQRLRDSFFRACHIRRRFTVLDVAVRTERLDILLDGLFGQGAVWEI